MNETPKIWGLGNTTVFQPTVAKTVAKTVAMMLAKAVALKATVFATD
jgi:hypothetical protein